jgi:hypothetical protein
MSEISPEVVYWVTRLDHMRGIIGFLITLCVVTAFFSAIIAVSSQFNEEAFDCIKHHFMRYYSTVDDLKKEFDEKINAINKMESRFRTAIRIAILAAVGALFFVLGCAFVPNTKEACAILVIPHVANSNVVQQELPKSIESIVRIANNYLEEKLTTPSKKGGKE